MQIRKFHLYVWVYIKTNPENFAFLILRISELFTREVRIFWVRISQKVNAVIMRNLRYVTFM